jgi:hypothetical protein
MAAAAVNHTLISIGGTSATADLMTKAVAARAAAEKPFMAMMMSDGKGRR